MRHGAIVTGDLELRARDCHRRVRLDDQLRPEQRDLERRGIRGRCRPVDWRVDARTRPSARPPARPTPGVHSGRDPGPSSAALASRPAARPSRERLERDEPHHVAGCEQARTFARGIEHHRGRPANQLPATRTRRSGRPRSASRQCRPIPRAPLARHPSARRRNRLVDAAHDRQSRARTPACRRDRCARCAARSPRRRNSRQTPPPPRDRGHPRRRSSPECRSPDDRRLSPVTRERQTHSRSHASSAARSVCRGSKCTPSVE